MSSNAKKRAARGRAGRPARAADAGGRTSGRTSRSLLLGIGLVALAAGGWAFLASAPTETTAAQPASVVQSLSVKVHRAFPHDTSAYTQGLLWWDGRLYESTGQYGSSDLRRLDPETGAVEQELDISPAYFGEGLARVDDRLIMLTWKAQRAFVFGVERFDEQRTFRYDGEGWGLCNDGSRLVMSNGSNRLTFRDLRTFEVLGDVAVTLRGFPLTQLNELECVGDAVYANVYQTDFRGPHRPGNRPGDALHRGVGASDAGGIARGRRAQRHRVRPRRPDLLHHRQAVAEDVRGDVRVAAPQESRAQRHFQRETDRQVALPRNR